jgi:hypothetical protein
MATKKTTTSPAATTTRKGREIRIFWKSINEDADKLKEMSTVQSTAVAASTVLLSRSLMAQSRKSPTRKEMAAKLHELHELQDGCSERLLVIQGFRVMSTLVGRGRFTAEVGENTYVVE